MMARHAGLLPLLLPCLLLLLHPHSTQALDALVCPEGSEGPQDQPLGAECGGHCSYKGTCAPGLVCGPSEEGENFLLSMPSKLATFVRSSLGRAAVGTCVPAGNLDEEEAEEEKVVTRELLQDAMLRQESSLLSRQEETGTCPGCPHAVDVNNEDVVAAARAGLELMKAKGEFGTYWFCWWWSWVYGFGWVSLSLSPSVERAASVHPTHLFTYPQTGTSEAEQAKVTLARIVSASSQVVSGIRYRIIVAVARVSPSSSSDLSFYEVDVVSQPWMTPKYTLVGSKKVDAPMEEEKAGGGK